MGHGWRASWQGKLLCPRQNRAGSRIPYSEKPLPGIFRFKAFAGWPFSGPVVSGPGQGPDQCPGEFLGRGRDQGRLIPSGFPKRPGGCFFRTARGSPRGAWEKKLAFPDDFPFPAKGRHKRKMLALLAGREKPTGRGPTCPRALPPGGPKALVVRLGG